MDLSIASQDDNVICLQVSGGITQKQLHQSAEILPKLAGKDVYQRKVLMNLQNNGFIDSSGINWLLLCHKRFTENKGRMVLHSVPAIVDSVLKILRMEAVFEIAGTEDEARKLAMSPRPAPTRPAKIAAVTEDADDEVSSQDEAEAAES